MTDTTDPTLTSLSFQSPVNISGGAAPITFTAGATDDLSGVDHVYIWFTTSLNYGYPNSTVTGNGPLFILNDYEDSFSDGQSSITRTITPFNAPGNYTIDRVQVFDEVNNSRTYNTAQLAALGAQTSLTIVGGVTDTIAPTLTSLSFQSPVNISGGAAPITFTAGATDDLSGVDHVYIWFTTSLNYGYPNSTVTGNGPLFILNDYEDSPSAMANHQ